ncbi:hypothetical protein K474DRAFT_1664094 [Panus rudis PR-1116 ss-1]|nr:hypothetical protein K474DRAFT_1664094 [Panus rudis PR-1116 ss-1]
MPSIIEPSLPRDMETAATRIYQLLVLLRANDKNIWPISVREQRYQYDGPQRAMIRGKVDMSAMLDTLAFLSVLNDSSRVALAVAVNPSRTTLVVAQDDPGNPRLPEHLFTLWCMLRQAKEATDLGDVAGLEHTRRSVFLYLYRACAHHIATAIRTGEKAFEHYRSKQKIDDIEDPARHATFLGDIEVLSTILFDGQSYRTSLSSDDVAKLIEVCESFCDLIEEDYELLASWTRCYRSAEGIEMDFPVQRYLLSICTLHHYITYILLFASTRSRYREILENPLEVTLVPPESYHCCDIPVSTQELFALLKNAVDPRERDVTIDRLEGRLATELPHLSGGVAAFNGHSHCECALVVYAHNHAMEVTHIGISSKPCYACSRFLLACTGLVGHFTSTFDRLFHEEFDLPWSLPPPFYDRTHLTSDIDFDLTTLIWRRMSAMLFCDVGYMWSHKASTILEHYKARYRYKD